MVLNEQELLQIDEEFISRLLVKNPSALAELSIALVNDLKEARERLNQNPFNSSKPPSSLAPWEKSTTDDDAKGIVCDGIVETSTNDISGKPRTKEDASSKASDQTSRKNAVNDKPKNKPGRQPNSLGFGRTQTLPITDTEHHHCHHCSVCNHDILSVEKAYTGFYSVNVVFGDDRSPGLRLTNIQHIYYQAQCPNCGLENRTKPWRAVKDKQNWSDVDMTQWRLIGPDLAAMIVYLSMDMRITRRKVQLFLYDILGLQLSVGSIQNCLLESARALAPVENQLVDELLSESIMYADETSHNEGGSHLWLWVFITASCALFLVGQRSKDMFVNMLESSSITFDGYLMSDGYRVYRDFIKRLRCWAHLQRKAKGLAECYTSDCRHYGKQLDTLLDQLINAVYNAREGPDKGHVSITANHQGELGRLRELCEAMAVSSHKKTRALGREFLNDWDAIFRVLEHPVWPLTNNEAERALRHWVIMRKITQGTRSEQGSRALALFASVITTCRLRHASPLIYIRDVIEMRRQGQEAPRLPEVPEPTLLAEELGV